MMSPATALAIGEKFGFHMALPRVHLPVDHAAISQVRELPSTRWGSHRTSLKFV